MVIVVRPGNPKGIKGWDDLIKPGIQIVTPDPASSGSAKWNILAAYTHVLKNGGTEDQAKAYLTAYYKNIVAKPSSGAQATATFLNGTGDVLISYESEAIGGRQKGDKFDYVVPAESMLIETPAAVTTDASQAAKDFLAYAESDAGQKIFASKGFRPAVQGVDPGTVEGANDPAQPVPDRGQADHDRRARRLERGQQEVLRQEHRHRHRDRGQRRVSTAERTAASAAPDGARRAAVGRSRPARRSGSGPLSGLGLGAAVLWMSLLVLLPLAAVVVGVHRERVERVLGLDHRSGGRRRRCGSRSAARCWSARSTR